MDYSLSNKGHIGLSRCPKHCPRKYNNQIGQVKL